MTRRAAAGLGRLLPLLLITAAVVVVAGAALLAACGGSSGGSSTVQPTATVTVTTPGSATTSPQASPSPSASPAQTTLRLYFLRDEKLGVAERRVAHTTMPATASMRELLAGPTSAESAADLTSAIPAGTRLLGLTLDGSTARVDLSSRFASGSDRPSMRARVAEVVYTLTRYPTVDSVQLLVEGSPVDDLGGESIVLTAPQTRADWRDLEPAIFVESPGVGALVRSPFLLTGTASVFEGSFQARLVDSSGRRIVSVVMQASRGAPGRGRFSRLIAFSTSAKSGTLLVFDQSMENGSRQDEVKIPVTFAAD
jgi:Sporulation and spore germination/Immunoglobulin-like domain of bacterial spore germination